MKLMQKIAKETAEAAAQGDTKLGTTRHPAIDVVDFMVEAGRPGRLEKAGFYEYDENGKRLGIWQACAITTRPWRRWMCRCRI